MSLPLRAVDEALLGRYSRSKESRIESLLDEMGLHYDRRTNLDFMISLVPKVDLEYAKKLLRDL